MNRRLFFRAFSGAPIVAAASTPKTAKAELVDGCFDPVCAGCGMHLAQRRLDYDSPYFVICEYDPECPLHGKALLVPKVTVPAGRPDPRYVAKVLESERIGREAEAERERRRLENKERTCPTDHRTWNEFARARNAWREKYQRWDEPVYDERDT